MGETEITPDDYKKLQEENARLWAAFKHEKLRADFNAKGIAFYEETYAFPQKNWPQIVRRLHERDMRGYSVRSLCGLLGVSTQTYYKHTDTLMRKLAEKSFVIEFIKRVRQSMAAYVFTPSLITPTATFSMSASLTQTY